MNHTTFDQENKIVEGRATPYVAGPAPFMSKMHGFAGGSYYSNTHDVAIWQTALLSGKVVSLANLKKLTTAYRLIDGTDIHYGLGICV
jgi:CubicO group peptidase (beta-lactamase class C family)